MSKLVWDKIGEKRYETGLDRGVLYPGSSMGVPWNGLVAVDENVVEADARDLYYDGVKRGTLIHPGDFSATLRALTYPDEFLQFDGYVEDNAGVFFDNQPRKTFGLSYRTLVGNDVDGVDLGYKIHLLYNLLAKPADVGRETMNEGISPGTFSWELSATPIVYPGRRPTAHIVIDSTKTYPGVLSAIEDILYGTTSEPPRQITVAELAAMMTIEVIDNGDGTFTVIGPDEFVYSSGVEEYTIEAFGITFIDDTTYTMSSS